MLPRYIQFMTKLEVFTSALDLPEPDRAKLVLALLRSLEPGAGLAAEDWDQAWDSEVTRRLNDWRNGKARSRPADESVQRVRERLAALK